QGGAGGQDLDRLARAVPHPADGQRAAAVGTRAVRTPAAGAGGVGAGTVLLGFGADVVRRGQRGVPLRPARITRITRLVRREPPGAGTSVPRDLGDAVRAEFVQG